MVMTTTEFRAATDVSIDPQQPRGSTDCAKIDAGSTDYVLDC